MNVINAHNLEDFRLNEHLLTDEEIIEASFEDVYIASNLPIEKTVQIVKTHLKPISNE